MRTNYLRMRGPSLRNPIPSTKCVKYRSSDCPDQRPIANLNPTVASHADAEQHSNGLYCWGARCCDRSDWSRRRFNCDEPRAQTPTKQEIDQTKTDMQRVL